MVAIASLAGCATSHSVVTLPDGITVHTFRRDYSNAHVVTRGEELLMVDAGLEANAPALEADLRSAGFDPARLKAIVLTHGHADHAGGAAYFQRRFGTRIVAGAKTESCSRLARTITFVPPMQMQGPASSRISRLGSRHSRPM